MARNLTFADLANKIEQGANGENTYSNDKAMYGFISANKFLQIPKDLERIFGQPPDLDVTALGKRSAASTFIGPNSATHRTNHAYIRMGTATKLDILKIAICNFKTLRVEYNNDGHAFAAAMLRARWMTLGCYYQTTATRCVTLEEVNILPDNVGFGKTIADIANMAELVASQDVDIVAFLAISNTAVYSVEWCVNWAETIWSITEYLFRTRGHHYKPEYKEMIKKMYNAATQGNSTLPDDFPFDVIFHAAIHPFGIKALAVMTFHFCAHGKIGNSMIMRLSAASNGFAIATTASACLHAIGGEPWYHSFDTRYKAIITKIHAFSAELLDNKYAFHLAASLYGLSPLRSVTVGTTTTELTEVDQIVGSIAPFLQAFINYCTGLQTAQSNIKYSFANAKVLEKRAATNPVAVQKLQSLIEMSVNAVERSETIADAIEAAFPTDLVAKPPGVP